MGAGDLLYVDGRNPIHRVARPVHGRLVRAQNNLVTREFPNSAALLARVFDELKLQITPPKQLLDQPATVLSDVEFSELCGRITEILRAANVPGDALPLQAASIAQRIQLLRAFENPESILTHVATKVMGIVATFPRSARDIECGRNRGDVLDPYILAATQVLLHGGDFTSAIATTVGHKALMIIEGLMGHLHEDVIGDMRGNVRVPEPRGLHQEMLDLETNPFPGADLLQPPYEEGGSLRFHQVKSKTGSAKGGDGARLGTQLKRLQDYYGGAIFYDALIGNTLSGHRSRKGVERTAPGVIVLVGEAAFREVTHSPVGPHLLLRVYQAAFHQAAAQTGYRVEVMTEEIIAAFAQRATVAGDTIMESILDAATGGPAEKQDSRVERRPERKRKR